MREHLKEVTSSDDTSIEGGQRRVASGCFAVSGRTWRLEILCGITVALALVPEAVAFALAGGLEPSIGLNSAWIVAIFTGVLGGRPAMICGATGSLAVLLGTTVKEYGKEYLFYAVILMGAIEIVLGFLQVGTLVKLIPSPVMMGFCNGLALVIGLAQFSNYKIPQVQSMRSSTGAGRAALLIRTMPARRGTAFEWLVVRAAAGSQTTIVGDIAALHFGGDFPVPLWLDGRYSAPPLNAETFSKVSSLAVTMAAVGLLESLMTLNLIDEITRSERSSTTRECIGQGVANIVCGAFGGMGGCAMIGQSMINIVSGARMRVSSVCAGVCLLLIVVAVGPVINRIPVSALVGVMFNVVFHTFEWGSLKLMALAAMPLTLRRKFFSEATSKKKIRRADALVILAVTVVTVLTNLATAVACGMLLSLFMFALDSSELISVTSRTTHDSSSGNIVKYYDVHGILFFGSTARFLQFFDEDSDPEDVYLAFESGYIADFSAIEALNKLGERYGTHGKRITLQELKPRSCRILSKALRSLLRRSRCRLAARVYSPQSGSTSTWRASRA